MIKRIQNISKNMMIFLMGSSGFGILFDALIAPIVTALIEGNLTISEIPEIALFTLGILFLVFNTIILICISAIFCEICRFIVDVKHTNNPAIICMKKILHHERLTRYDFKWIPLHWPRNQQEYWKYMGVIGCIIAFIYCLIIYWPNNSGFGIVGNIITLCVVVYNLYNRK